MFGIQFYPTPINLAYKLISKLNMDKVSAVLESSAGKGDFINALYQYRETELDKYSIERENPEFKFFFDNKQELFAWFFYNFGQDFCDTAQIREYLNKFETEEKTAFYFREYKSKYHNSNLDVTCVEIDENLCAILKQNKHRFKVINADFLTWCSFDRFDTVLMNPPFADGDKHLLRVLSLMEQGGQICCILNAETIRNPYSNTRQLLVQKLTEYNAEIEYVENAFKNAEIQADVDVALIYINIPDKVISEDIARNFVKGDVYEKEYKELSDTQLYAGDSISLLLEQFALEARYGLKIIDTFNAMKQYIPVDKDCNQQLIKLVVLSCGEDNISQANQYIRQLRQKYWELVFQTNEISRLLTDGARAKYQCEIRRFRDYDFTVSNIKQLQIELSQSLNSNVNEAIINLYDMFTYRYAKENPTNVHLFNGWHTNKGFKVNPKKVIVPLYFYNSYGYDMYKARDFLTEVEKVFTYLDGGKKDGKTVEQLWNWSQGFTTDRLEFKYFDVELKKKGTVHIYWKDYNLVKKLTIIGCKAHNALPNDYGTKQYESMTEEEKTVVDSFEGEKEYTEDTTTNANFYLETSGVKLLEVN